MKTKLLAKPGPNEATVVTKAALRAADRLALNGAVFARIVGV